MRIQHNIAAMSSYRNLTNNNNMVTKSLEKLSSGYRINRAGDDAAGLAISEKMRAQIKGLETAQKNANDGISLVQTAEGALTEVHSMLNRMVELATQSANGTYQNEVDREQLQKEVAQLNDEIDRIADASNFNGIKLLDGSLGGGGSVGSSGPVSITGSLDTNRTAMVKANYVTEAVAANKDLENNNDTITYSFALDNGKSYNVKLTYDSTNNKIKAEDGTEYAATQNDVKVDEIQKALTGELKKSLGNTYKISCTSAGILTLEGLKSGSGTPEVVGITKTNWTKKGLATDDTAVKMTTSQNGADSKAVVETGGIGLYDGTDESIFTINGKKFAIVANSSDDVSKIGKDVNVIVGAIESNDTAGQIGQALGLKGTYSATAVGSTKGYIFEANTSKKSSGSGGGLTLQIGDTADSFNQLNVSVKDMHTGSLGIAGVDIGNQAGAAAAIQDIKNAINTVSDVRGTLGATQNRLEHTINNLSVQTENITAAESRIRDTDMANEMMAYTKNNILVQAAQAMLAQANQVPQGVLQLLQ